jgi:hypothetical protein
LELQLDLFLVALRIDPGPDRPLADPAPAEWPRWDGETLDLTAADPAAESLARLAREPMGDAGESGENQAADWLQARFAALSDTIDEAFAIAEVRRHPAVMARLLQARSICAERRAALERPEPSVASAHVSGDIQAGHFLG